MVLTLSPSVVAGKLLGNGSCWDLVLRSLTLRGHGGSEIPWELGTQFSASGKENPISLIRFPSSRLTRVRLLKLEPLHFCGYAVVQRPEEACPGYPQGGSVAQQLRAQPWDRPAASPGPLQPWACHSTFLAADPYRRSKTDDSHPQGNGAHRLSTAVSMIRGLVSS